MALTASEPPKYYGDYYTLGGACLQLDHCPSILYGAVPGRESFLSSSAIRQFFVILVFAPSVAAGVARAQYDPPASYYDSATGTGTVLKAQLNAIIDQHTSIAYSNRESPLEDLDQDPANPSNVIEVYSGYSVPNSQFPVSGQVDTEHLWPNSYGIDDTNPAYGDLFNLRPCDSTVNGYRANKYFDNGGTLPAHAEAPLCRGDADSWEVRDVEKGDIARAMFYMDTRYEGDPTDGFARNLTLTDSPPYDTGENTFGKLSTLIAWSYADPVSNEEKARNQRIYSTYQHNRNPYVDHPEYVWAVFGSGPNNSRLYFGTTPPANGASLVELNYRVIKGAAAPSQPVPLNKTGTHPTTYNITASGAAVTASLATAQCFSGGSAIRTIQVALDSTATAGFRSGSITIDNTDLTSAGAGLGSADGNDVITLTAAVLEHANASFSPSADQNALTLDFGNRTALTGQHALPFSIYNFGTALGYTAALDIDTVNATGHTAVLASNLSPSSNLPAGQSRTFTATLNTDTVGAYQAVIAIAVSDENVTGATSGAPLTLTLKANITAALVAPDFNADGHVDHADYDTFAACFTGPNVPLTGTTCSSADFDGDTDVDLADFARFQRCFTGSTRPPDPACAD